jgi:hypothetical protein
VCHESTGEARDKHHRRYQGDQVNVPRVVASAHKIDMGGAVFVSICVKAHGGSLHLRSAVPSEKIPNGPRRGPPLAHTEYHVPRPPGARISGQAGIFVIVRQSAWSQIQRLEFDHFRQSRAARANALARSRATLLSTCSGRSRQLRSSFQ